MSPTLPIASSSTRFFGFSKRPFRGTPDPEDYVGIDGIDQEVQRLIMAAAQGDGIAVLTAAPGAGKTLVCHRLQVELSRRFEAVVLSSSGFATRRSLLQAVLFALGQSYASYSEQELRLSILKHARTLATSREGIVLIVDEAHLLNARLLEELRCLTNHSQEGKPLIRVVLCGQLPLEDLLVDPALEALNYRITCHATLEPASMQESARLVAGRLTHAGGSVEETFTHDALETICRVSDGNPRCLVQLCEQSLRIAAERNEVPIDVETVRLALQELKQLPLQWNESAIDQPQSGQDLEQIETAASGAVEPAATEDVSLAHDIDVVPDADDQDVLAWSSPVSSVELGGERDSQDPAPSAAGWTSYEPECGWEPTAREHAAAADESDAAMPTCGTSENSPRAVSASSAEASPWSESLAETREHCGEVVDGPPVVNAPRSSGFVELPVDDTYAALDARTRPTALPCDGNSFDQMLHSSVTIEPGHRPSAAREPIPGVDPTGEPDTTSAPADGQPADPVQRLDDVIAALSEVTDGSSVDVSEWQSAGDCRDLDVLEPGGEPQWDRAEISSSPRHEDSVGVDVHAAAGQSQRGGMASSESTHCRQRRPYARLFSRARQRHS